MDKSIRILIADDHLVVREGLALLLERQEDMTVVAAARDGQEAVEMFRRHRPDVTLMDLNMPVMSGIAAIQAIRQEYPKAQISILTTYEGDDDIYRGIQAGASGYLLKDAPREQLLETIRLLDQGQTLITPNIAAKLAERLRYRPLTARELEVLERIKEGKSNQEIASELFIVEGTVKSHVNSILEKLGVSDRTQAVTSALQRGIIHLDR